MIPIRLSLRNFMCYHEDVPPVHFGGIHIASISGRNGDGKSALIDAMTWALWGQTRAKRDDDLVYSGEMEAAVEFDFALGDQVYRVLRRHSKPKRRGASGQTSLEFQVAVDEGFRAITGDTIAQTQEKIVDTLHMDYATFTNSAYLRQGHADEFTTSNPAKRKQVLASILGLSVYDRFEAQAREIAREKETEGEQLQSVISEILDELANGPRFQNELAEAEAELSRLVADIEQRQSKLNALRQQKQALETQQSEMAKLDQLIEQRERTLAQWQRQLEEQGNRIKSHEEVIARRESIETGHAQLVEVRQANDELEQKFRRSVNLDKQKAQIELKLNEASQELVKRHAVVESRIEQLATKTAGLPGIKTKQQETEHRLQHVAEEETALRERTESGHRLRADLQTLETGQAQLVKDIAEVNEKLDLLVTEHGASCPLCETELGEDSLKLIEAKYVADRQQKTASLDDTRNRVSHDQETLKSLATELTQLESRLKKERETLQGQASLVTREAEEAEKAGQELEEQRAELADIEQQLTRRDFAAPQQAMLDEIEQELTGLDYDAARHEQVRRQLADLEQYDEPKRRLDEADRQIEDERAAAERASEAAGELEANLTGDRRKRQELVTALESLPAVADELAAAEREHATATGQQQRLQETVGSLKGRLERLAELETRKQDREESLSRAAGDEAIYRELAEAFGKRGIQALLIETAIPEIEIEANRLLGRMTDYRMNVKIETQRETQRGTTIETLDINISDELGTRNYEMFSGGEAFRINFAIRVALSKLLAHRAGAPLPTLIIDEGFGTQDSVGIEKLKEAINSIQDDFNMILVITHIEELRDAFPARIDVTKTAAGSTVSFG